MSSHQENIKLIAVLQLLKKIFFKISTCYFIWKKLAICTISMSQLYMPESYPSIVYYVTSTYMLYVSYKLYFSISKKYTYFTFIRTFVSRSRNTCVKQSRIHTIMYQDIYIDNNEAKKKWFPLGFISLFKTVWLLWFLFILIILHFIGDSTFLLQFNTLLTLELRPRGDPDVFLRKGSMPKYTQNAATTQQHLFCLLGNFGSSKARFG